MNDLLIIENNLQQMKSLKFKLNQVFKMVDLKKPHVSMSTMEIKYTSMSLAAKELVSLREMCTRILKFYKIFILYDDNIAAINIANRNRRFSVSEECGKLVLSLHKNLIIKWILSED